ncbi:MAG: hypothetical protein IJZ57_07980 [Clostridia bacterium]|nr:hypothetical protein [Clostridia bacterium]
MIRTVISFLLSIIIAIFPPLANIINPHDIEQQLEIISVVDTVDFNIMLKDKDGNTVYDSEFSDQETPTPPDTVIPFSYDAREQGLVTSVKNQASTGACWSFAAISAAESSAVKSGFEDVNTVDYSEAHLTWFGLRSLSDNEADPTCGDGIFSDSPYTDGGNWMRSVFALARWSGAEKEENAPFNGFPEAMGNYGEENRYSSYAHLQNSKYISPDDETGIKQAIIDNGSITVSFYYSQSFLNYSDNGAAYYQKSVTNTNHTAVIVGWDDDFSKDNFKRAPERDGAWLVKNSWGEYWGTDGYCWVSYCDPSLSCFVTYEMESADNYDNIYQYDGFGYKGWAYITGENKMTMANVFTADSLEALKAVSFHTVQNDVDYTVRVFTLLDEDDLPTDGKLSAEKSGHLDHRGYYTVELDEPVPIKAGSRYSVVVSITVPDGYNACIPLEYPEGFDGAHNRSYSAEEGVSYFTVGDDYSQWTDSAQEGYNNVCIKAFTDEMQLALKGKSTFRMSLGYLTGVYLQMSTDYIINQFYNRDAVYENGFVMLYDTLGNLIDSLEISFYGDIDDDGEVNKNDYELLSLILKAEVFYDDKDAAAGDLDFDGTLSTADLKLLEEYIKSGGKK